MTYLQPIKSFIRTSLLLWMTREHLLMKTSRWKPLVIQSWELPIRWILEAGWHRDGSTRYPAFCNPAKLSTSGEVRREVMRAGISVSNTRAEWRRWKFDATTAETLHYFVVLMMTGVWWWWHKRKLLPLAPSNTLSNHPRHSSLCQAGSHLDMRHHANSFRKR